MILRITNKCEMGCLHCMEESTPTGKHMSIETLNNSLDLIIATKNTKTIGVSGGEPTEHPDFKNLLELIIKRIPKNRIITLITNGLFLSNDKLMTAYIFSILNKYSNVVAQITSIKGIYPRYDDVIQAYHKIRVCKNKNYRNALKKISLTTKLEHDIVPVGRAIKNESKLIDLGYGLNPNNATRCFNLYNALQHDCNLINVIDMIKSKTTSFCIPLIKENGELVFGEYESCNSVVNVNSLDNGYNINITNIKGPCGGCINKKSSFDILKMHLIKYESKFNKLKINIENKDN